MIRSIPFILLLLLIVRCSIHPGSLKKLHKKGIHTEDAEFKVELPGNSGRKAFVTYLGCGGILVRLGNDAILVDPFFSNQKTGKIGRSVFLGKEGKRILKPDSRMISKGLEAIKSSLGANGKVRMILSAHSHYDHLMDIPALYSKLDEKPTLLLTQSGHNIVHRTIEGADVKILEDFESTFQHGAPPIQVASTSGSIRVYPVRAEHNPHFRNVKFFSGGQRTPLNEMNTPWDKTRANLWLEGNTFSFVIDFIDETGAVSFRAFIQSSSCNPPNGIPPQVLRDRPVDIAFIGVVSYKFSPGYPCELLEAISPRQVVWVHWEDFFRRYDRKPKTVRGTDVPAFFELPCVAPYIQSGKILWPRVKMDLIY